MKRSISIVAVLALNAAFAGVIVAGGPPVTGTVVAGIDPVTGLTDQPVSGETFYVDASVHSNTPIVAYEYAIRNECGIAGKPGYSIQQDDIVAWTSGTATDPHVTMPIYLQTVATGSKCKVFLVRNGNVTVKGSTLSYTVG
jgi:hypothetical protein